MEEISPNSEVFSILTPKAFDLRKMTENTNITLVKWL